MQTQPRLARPHFWPNWKQRPLFAVLMTVFLLALIVFVATKSVTAIQDALDHGKPDAQQITVEGEGTAMVAPDTATISLGVESKGASVATAQDENTKTTNTLIERIKALDIAPEDIRTTNYNAYEEETWNPETGDYVSKGWIVSQDLTVTLHDLDKVPAVLQVAGQSGVTNIYGPNFETKNVADIRTQAREEAISSALKQAEAIAEALDVKIDGVLSYSEWTYDYGYPMYAEVSKMDAGGGVPPAIEPGTEEYKITVSITYQLSN